MADSRSDDFCHDGQGHKFTEGSAQSPSTDTATTAPGEASDTLFTQQSNRLSTPVVVGAFPEEDSVDSQEQRITQSATSEDGVTARSHDGPDPSLASSSVLSQLRAVRGNTSWAVGLAGYALRTYWSELRSGVKLAVYGVDTRLPKEETIGSNDPESSTKEVEQTKQEKKEKKKRRRTKRT